MPDIKKKNKAKKALIIINVINHFKEFFGVSYECWSTKQMKGSTLQMELGKSNYPPLTN